MPKKKNDLTALSNALPISELGKIPPQAPDFERAVLGALMLEKNAYSSVADLLHPNSFYDDKHRLIYEAITSLAIKDEPIDLLMVTEQLKKLGTLEKAGNVAYISSLTTGVSSTAHLITHAKIIAQKSMARELISMASEIERNAYDESQDVDTLLQNAEATIFEISQRNQQREVFQIDPIINEAYNRIRRVAENKSGISGVPSGFKDLDRITAGWQKSDLIIIAARPAMGKTAFALSMAKNITTRYNKPVAMFSLEMSNIQLVNRLMMNVCEIDGNKIKTGKLTKKEWDILDEKIENLIGVPLYIDETPSLSIFELRSKARQLVREKHVELIIIDYLQLMNASGMNFISREQEVSIISRSLKSLAKELDIPIIALSQLNRNVESRTGIEGKTPQLSDLRESGAIEQDADLVCFIHRPEYYRIYNDEKTGKDLRNLAQIIIAKHRNGSTDSIWLYFQGQFAKFNNEEDLKLSDQQDYSTTTNIPSAIDGRNSHLHDKSVEDISNIDDNPPF